MDNSPLGQRLHEASKKQRGFGRHLLASLLWEAAEAVGQGDAIRGRAEQMLSSKDPGWNRHLYFILEGRTDVESNDDQRATG